MKFLRLIPVLSSTLNIHGHWRKKKREYVLDLPSVCLLMNTEYREVIGYSIDVDEVIDII